MRMTDKDPSKFRIRLDDDIPDSTLQEDVENLRITKLSRKITLIAIFIPCVVGAILFFAYLDLNKRVGKVHVTGTTEVRNVSKDLESRISTLAYEFSSSKESLTKQIASIESNLKEATTAIKYIRSARQTDNTQFKDQLTEIENKLIPIQKNLDLVISEIKNFDKKVARELVQLTNTVQKSNNDLQKDISTLSAAKISKKAFDLAMIDQQVRFQEKLNQVTARFEKQVTARFEKELESFRQKIAELEKAQAAYNKSKPMQPIIPPRTTPAPEKEANTPKSEAIIEQDIQEKP
jgi:hypothetical protein